MKMIIKKKIKMKKKKLANEMKIILNLIEN